MISDFGELETNGLNIHGNILKATVFHIAGDDFKIRLDKIELY